MQAKKENNITDNRISVGSRIKELRKKNNLTQVEFAKKLGVKQSTISAIEVDKNSISLNLSKKISEIFNVSIDWIQRGDKEKNILLSNETETGDNIKIMAENEIRYVKNWLLNIYNRLQFITLKLNENLHQKYPSHMDNVLSRIRERYETELEDQNEVIQKEGSIDEKIEAINKIYKIKIKCSEEIISFLNTLDATLFH